MSALFDNLQRLFDQGHGTELPGLRTDAMFAPPGEVRPAAVLIAVTDRSEPGVLLTHRPHDMRQHPGQVAFPGGKLDPGEDAVAAALREAHEELAIEAHEVKVIGASDRFITNAANLGIDLCGVEDVVLSHNHGDHTKGLVALRKRCKTTNPNAAIRAHVGGPEIFWPRLLPHMQDDNVMPAVKPEYEAEGGGFLTHETSTPLANAPGAAPACA